MSEAWADAKNVNMNITKFIDLTRPIEVLMKDIGIENDYSANNPHIQFRFATGHSESTTESVAKYGTPGVAADGSLEYTGEGLSEVLKPALKGGGTFESNNKILNDLYKYFQMEQAKYQIEEQGKKTAFNYANIEKELPALRQRPGFQEAWSKYQDFNKRMLDFYVDTNYMTRKQADQFQEDHPYYVPTHRVIAQNSTSTGGSKGIKRRSVKGSERQLLPVDNIFAQLEKHISSALLARAESNLFQQLANNPNGAKWATPIKKRTERYKALEDQQARHFASVLLGEGMTVNEDGEVVPVDDDNPQYEQTKNDMIEIMVKKIKDNPALATFYTFGQEPISLDGSVRRVIIGGEVKYFEINKGTENGKLLLEMFHGIDNTYSRGWAVKTMHFAKNVMTRTIVATPDFFLGNLFVDTTTAGVYTHTNQYKGKNQLPFIPGVSSAVGAASVFKEDQDFKDFALNGGMFGTRVEMTTKENAKRQMMKSATGEVSLSRTFNMYDRALSIGEMATRVAEYKRAKKLGIDALAAAHLGTEITTDFNMHGANESFNKLRSTVAFLPASINSQYKDYREFKGTGSFFRSKEFFLGAGRLALRGFTIISIPAIISILSEGDDDEEKLKTVASEALFSYYKIGDVEFKHKTQYLLGYIFEKAPKMAREAFIKDRGERAWEIAKLGTWAMMVPDAIPTIASPFVDIATNKKFTGAPVVPRRLQSLDDDEKYLQFTERTPEMYKQAAAKLKEIGINASPLEIEHITKGYLGYVSKWIEDGFQRALWNEDEYGEMANQRDVVDHLAHHFKYKDYGQTYWSQKYYEEKSKYESKAALLTQAKRMIKSGQVKEGKELLKGENIGKIKQDASDLRKLDRRIGMIREQEKKIGYDKTLTAAQKEEQLKALHFKIGKLQKEGVEGMKAEDAPDFKTERNRQTQEDKYFKDVNKPQVETDYKEAIKLSRDSAKELRDLEAKKDRSKEDKVLYYKTKRAMNAPGIEALETVRRGTDRAVRKLNVEIKTTRNSRMNEKRREAKINALQTKIEREYKKGLAKYNARKRRYKIK